MHRPGKSTAPLLIVAVAVALTAGACSDSTPADHAAAAHTSVPTTTGPTTTAPMMPASPTEQVPADITPKRADASPDARLTPTDIRIGRHEGFDRVVFDLGGEGNPGWRVEYVDQAVQDASGKIIPVAGTAILQVLIDGAAYPFDSGAAQYSGSNPLRSTDAKVVTEVNLATIFEGVAQAFIGVSEPNKAFRVYALTNPTRLVVDVAD